MVNSHLMRDLPEYCTITSAVHIPGEFTDCDGKVYTGLPESLRICAELRVSERSFIRCEFWFPEKGWNGRFLGVGNGGAAGIMRYASIVNEVKKGYAVAHTDMGTSISVDLGVGNPDMWMDFGFRATHLMTVIGKILTENYYGSKPRYSYFIGSSTGGQQALAEAQRYPDDYDGIIAGVPANNRTLLHMYFMWNWQATRTDSSCAMFTDEQIRKMTELAVKFFQSRAETPGDWFVSDPRNTDGSAAKYIIDNMSLSLPQRAALEKLYSGPINPRTGERIYTPVPFGSEFSPPGIRMQQTLSGNLGLFYVFRWVFGKDYDYSRFDFDRDADIYNEALAPYVNANDPDLSRFKARGGRLIMFSGSTDPLVPYQDAVSYYDRVTEHQGGLDSTMDFFRYFISPGMSHGTDGPGAAALYGWENGAAVDRLKALTEWVEKGIAPEFMVAYRKDGEKPDLLRPVYPYPAVTICTDTERRDFDSFAPVMKTPGGVELIASRYLLHKVYEE